jgi:competence protein ComEC
VLRWGPYPFLRIVLFFSAGILTYLQVGKKPGFIFPLFALFLLGYLLAWVLASRRRSIHINNVAGLAGLGAIALLGFLVTHYQTGRVQPAHLLHLQEPVRYYVGVVEAYTVQKPGSQAATLALRRVAAGGRWRPVTGKVRLTVAKAPGFRTLQYGEVLLVKGAPEPVPPPANPGQFDYRQYLARQQVYHQHYRYPHQYLRLGAEPPNRLVAASLATRDHLDRQLRQYIPGDREYGVATALVLGIKDYLPEDLKTTYAHTGTMHVLAVSGLHVALLFYVLQLLIGRWGRGQAWRLGAFLLLLGIIWFYAFVTALSASVLRAVVMFSFIQASKAFRLPANIYNTLAAAAFTLLVYNPYLLVDVGFQLSFLAVYGIVYLQPRLYRWGQFNTWAGDYLWRLVSTSLAAQLAVLPLSLYYFHQFPVYFLVANLVAVILSNGALLLGFGLLALAGVPVLARGLGWGISALLQGMNSFSEALLRLPGPVISGITLSPAQAWLWYGAMGMVALLLARRRLAYLAGFTALVVGLSAAEVAEARGRQKQALMVVYQVRGATALAFIWHRQAVLLADPAFYAQPRHFQYAVQPHWWQLGVVRSRRDTLYSQAAPVGRRLADGNVLLSWRGLRVLVCRRPIKYKLHNIKLDYLVLTQNVKFHPESLPNPKRPFVVIMDGSNKSWYQDKWTPVLQARGFRVHRLSRHGAYVRGVD